MNAGLLYETHCHTPLCKHAIGEPEEYAAQAHAAGLRGIIFTCHGPLPDGISSSVRMDPDQLDDYFGIIDRARRAWDGKTEVHLGLESDYLPGLADWARDLHQSAPFDFVLGSVHPHIHRYQQQFFTGDWPAFHRIYFQHLADAAETGLFDSLAHPDIVKNLGHEEWDLPTLMPDIEAALDRIARTGTAIELNTSGLNKTVAEMNPAMDILRAAVQRGIPITLGADAHLPERVADRFPEALAMLREVGATHLAAFLNRQRRDIPLPDLL